MQRNKKKSGVARKGRKGLKMNQRPVEAAAVAYSQEQKFPTRTVRSRRIKNSELVGSIVGSIAFNADQTYLVNPGLSTSFPWLAEIAKQWQQYRFHRLCYRYVTRTATSEKGSVILSPDYNSRDGAPESETQASNTQDSVEDVVWKSLTCELDPSAMFAVGPRKQIRVGTIVGDTSTYDAARLTVCVVGEDGTDEIGKLWVDYDVELYVPQNSPLAGLSGPTVASVYRHSSSQGFATGVWEAQEWNVEVANPLGIGYVAGAFTAPAGTYHVTGHASYSDDTDELFTIEVAPYYAGVSLTMNTYARCDPSAASLTFAVPIDFVVTCDGTETFYVNVKLTGAAGTLTGLANNCILCIRPI
jgi:hypothetical protein